jgi:asparagine synthase (glutamine-hydrolysing)
MAVSLESRVPLLDHQLIEFAARVPSSMKLRGRTSKYLLRRILERHVPPAIVNAPKHGFTVPVGEWLRGPLAPLTTDLLFDGRLASRGLFRADGLRRLWNEHRTGRRDHRHRLWSLLMLELWFREFIDGRSRRSMDGAAA